MRVAIIGHGPSMLNGRNGKLIDQHDIVVRLKRCQKTLEYPELYGTKTDIVAGSYTIAPDLKGIGNASVYWVFTDSRHGNVTSNDLKVLENYFSPYHLVHDLDLCTKLNSTYRNLRTTHSLHPQMVEGKYSTPGMGHNHTSQGMHALFFALEKLKPSEISLFGFDNMASGQFTWSISRGESWNQYPDHRWDIEHELACMLEENYQIPLTFVIPELVS